MSRFRRSTIKPWGIFSSSVDALGRATFETKVSGNQNGPKVKSGAIQTCDRQTGTYTSKWWGRCSGTCPS